MTGDIYALIWRSGPGYSVRIKEESPPTSWLVGDLTRGRFWVPSRRWAERLAARRIRVIRRRRRDAANVYRYEAKEKS